MYSNDYSPPNVLLYASPNKLFYLQHNLILHTEYNIFSGLTKYQAKHILFLKHLCQLAVTRLQKQ